jgi:predicted negative regulator of RcsB-dependent stress response
VTYPAHAQKLQQKLEPHKALQFLGDIFLANGDEETANTLFTVALEGFTQMDVHQSRAQCMLHLGDFAKERGDLLTAARLWAEARPLFERSVQAKDVSQIDIRLAAVAKDY